MDYLQDFWKLEDAVETAALIFKRRFDRHYENTEIPKVDPQPALTDLTNASTEPVFKNFTINDIAAVEFGNMVSLKETDLGLVQKASYVTSWNKFLGIFIALDYKIAQEGQGDYPIDQIAATGRMYNNPFYPLGFAQLVLDAIDLKPATILNANKLSPQRDLPLDGISEIGRYLMMKIDAYIAERQDNTQFSLTNPNTDYHRHFADLEDSIEAGAYLLYRRFKRKGSSFADVLMIDSEPGKLEELNKPMWFNFRKRDLFVLQLGKLAALKNGGFHEAQKELYEQLRYYFFGTPLLFDYTAALADKNNFDPEEILAVLREHEELDILQEHIENVSDFEIENIGSPKVQELHIGDNIPESIGKLLRLPLQLTDQVDEFIDSRI
jgi:hypothetical protein